MKIEIQEEWYSLEQCEKNPNKLYIFGDNAMRVGNGGQAQIRPADNSYGIATKSTPMTNELAYFGDRQDEADIIFGDIVELYDVYIGMTESNYDTIVFPADGLGTGLSQMPERSPKLYKWMNSTIEMLFGVELPQKADN